MKTGPNAWPGRAAAAGLLAAGLAAGATPASAPSAAPAAASAVVDAPACVKSIDAAQFLAASQARGLVPVSDCLRVDVGNNRFFAPPIVACSVTFSSRKWLDPGWQFVRVKGVGGFTSSLEDGALVVTIEAKGGFSATEFTLRSKQPMPSDDCRAARLGDILK